MKVAITAIDAGFDAPLDVRFGRCSYFVLVDEETGEWEAFPNPALEAMGGAGTQAAQYIANLGAGKVVSGHFGPNAYEALEAAGIRMYAAGGGTVESLIEDLKAGLLRPLSGPTVVRKGGSGGRGGVGRR